FSASTSWAAFWAAAPPPKSTTRATSPPAAAWPSRSSRNPAGPPDSFIREISALRLLRHPHIVRLHEVLASRSSVYLVLELAKGGELISRVHDRGRLPDDLSRRLFHQLLSAVAYSHSRGVFHRDLKPENLLLTQCGTPAYVAPEILLSSKGTTGYDGAKADIWSCGVILFVLNAGYLPFNDRNLMSLYRKIHSGHHRCPRWTPPDLRRLISRLLDPNPATRVSVDGILRDPWFARGVDPEQLATMMRPRGSDAGLDDKPHRRRGGELNAFDLISFASGLDLSGLFVDAASDRQRFASVEPVDRILDRVEEVGKGEGLVVTREVEKGSAAVIDGRNGEFVLMLQVYQLTGGTSVVEVEVGGGAIGSFWNETLRPVLSGPLHLGGLG
ncbi:CBL-interacting serine threonine-protein kinase 11, partial [Musa troglodytarum]